MGFSQFKEIVMMYPLIRVSTMNTHTFSAFKNSIKENLMLTLAYARIKAAKKKK